jgi:hypothetical protein
VRAIRAPNTDDPVLDAVVEALRDQGKVVVRAAPGVEVGVALTVDRELVLQDGKWRVRDLASATTGASDDAAR